jgi:hypothetical protein
MKGEGGGIYYIKSLIPQDFYSGASGDVSGQTPGSKIRAGELSEI